MKENLGNAADRGSNQKLLSPGICERFLNTHTLTRKMIIIMMVIMMMVVVVIVMVIGGREGGRGETD